MNVKIRLIGPSDKESWLELRHALWHYHDKNELASDLDHMLANLEKEPVFVAENAEGHLVGMLEASIRSEAPGCETERIGYLEGWFVIPEWRKRGIGGQLARRAEEWAREQGCVEMASDTTSRFPLSPAAHKALGYEEVKNIICYRKDLFPR